MSNYAERLDDYPYSAKYVTGMRRAHKNMSYHDERFNCRMVGTFNIQIADPFSGSNGLGIESCNFIPSLRFEADGKQPKESYWLIEMMTNTGEPCKPIRGYAFRWQGTELPTNRLEIMTRSPIPDHWKQVDLLIRFPQPWSGNQISHWAADKFPNRWHQTFPWGPKKVDSQTNWNRFSKYIEWSGSKVLDIGCNFGFYSFEAAKAGAQVHGIEPDAQRIKTPQIIAEHIEMLDVTFSSVPAQRVFGLDSDLDFDLDVILYLSVHHQWNPAYNELGDYIDGLCMRARKHVVVELIQPPMFGGNHADLLKTLGGKVIDTYEHEVRGTRRLYLLEGKAAAL